MGKKVLLGASYSIIEPLGCLYLSSVARQEGWQPKIALARNGDFSDLAAVVNDFDPDVVGLSLYTGNHQQAFNFLDSLRKKRPDTQLVLGGPHATYFPEDSLKHADYIVLSEGLNGFRRILRGETSPGIVHLQRTEQAPLPDRESFYRDHPDHRSNPIKSITTQTGCPYSCSYCYNSSPFSEVSRFLNEEQRQEMEQALSPLKRLFPRSLRSVDEVVREARDIQRLSPETKMIYFQDDVFGANLEWTREFAKKFPSTGLKFHAQMRFEVANPSNQKNRESLELIRSSGCTGLTFAIESSDPTIRKEVLNRPMSEELMFKVFEYIGSLGYRARTEQMLGLPAGATTAETKVNLDADLETLELNVRLRSATGLPTMAWASIFAPYKGTKIGSYCQDHGFYNGSNNDVPASFFERSVLNFPRQWTGPSLSPDNGDAWLDPQELGQHKDRLQLLRDLFTFFALIPEGHKLAKSFLNNQDTSYSQLSTQMRRHLYDNVLYGIA